jgi:hypothetical protein
MVWADSTAKEVRYEAAEDGGRAREPSGRLIDESLPAPRAFAWGDRWRALWYEDGKRRLCQSVSEEGLAKVTVRLAADAPGMERR